MEEVKCEEILVSVREISYLCSCRARWVALQQDIKAKKSEISGDNFQINIRPVNLPHHTGDGFMFSPDTILHAIAREILELDVHITAAVNKLERICNK